MPDASPDPLEWMAPVARSTKLTPNMRRITLAGGDLGRFESSGTPDESLLLAFPPDGAEKRSYTVRRWDADALEMDIDFAVHAGGTAARWAAKARPGETVGFSTASGWYAPPHDAKWELLLADMTALPAVGRILEEMPSSTRVHVIAEVTTPEDQQDLVTDAELTVTWLHGTGNGIGNSLLAEAARSWWRPNEPGYVWFAGEAKVSRVVRRWLRHDLGWPADRYDVIGYWRENKEQWEARYETVREQIEAATSSALAAGDDFDSVRDTVDEALDRAGL
ncbi:NADPH-dependent ferric siderophore reductase [Rhodococcus sp. WMMA185]|uniref:siderophore-interacting protein n=1 Tax=Rhodococcus sp. WMMA185 TaxID=679318 RepID=UPI000878966A|nr:siderophore-interacting protein [Rhodococcus sp. WMMA185]AOW92292.1 NADPH-dependent ferric siderophore reductase [Rhodococcus sp. WMMA185]